MDIHFATCLGRVLCGVLCAAVVGCGGRRSSLLLERQARGPITEEQAIAKALPWVLEPVTQTQTQNGVEVVVTYASPAYLNDFFSNRQVFGAFAGLNPYFMEQLVFSVKIANRSGKKLRIDPDQFVLLDDRGNQYRTLSADYATALAEAKAPIGTLTRGVLEEARPGYFGVGVPVGKIIGKPQQRFALLKMASLQGGYLHDRVIYDGLIAFWSPHQHSRRLMLVLTDIKTNFDPAEVPRGTMDFVFEFAAHHPTR